MAAKARVQIGRVIGVEGNLVKIELVNLDVSEKFIFGQQVFLGPNNTITIQSAEDYVHEQLFDHD